MVILHEIHVDSRLAQEFTIEGLREETTMIAEFLRDQDLHIRDFCGHDLHGTKHGSLAPRMRL